MHRQLTHIDRFLKRLSQHSPLALFVGAGISVSAGIPSAPAVVRILQSRFPRRLRSDRRYAYAQAFNRVFPGPKHRGDRRAFIEGLCAGATPSTEHLRIAQLVQAGTFQWVATTNFDHLAELAILASGSEAQVVLYDEDIDTLDVPRGGARVLKLHGDFLFDDLANLGTEMRRRLHAQMRGKLASLLRDSGLVVMGYGGHDLSIMEFLKDAAASPHQLTNGLWWFYHSERELANPHLVELGSILASQAKPFGLIGPISAVDALARIAAALHLPPIDASPLSPALKVRNLFLKRSNPYERPLQRPPAPTQRSSRRVPRNLHAAVTALAHGGAYCVSVSSPGETGQLADQLSRVVGRDNVFYFCDRFAENPVLNRLQADLVAFAARRGIAIPSASFLRGIVDHLLSESVVFLFDATYAGASHVQKHYWERVIDIMASGAEARRGTVAVLLRPQHLASVVPDLTAGLAIRLPSAAGFFVDASGVKPAVVPPNLVVLNVGKSRLAPKADTSASVARRRKSRQPNAARRLERLLALLRFAHNPTALRVLTGDPLFSVILSSLAETGEVERRGERFTLTPPAIDRMAGRRKPRALHLRLALRYVRLAQESSALMGLHYALEAEHHFWEAGDSGRGLLQILGCAASLLNHGFDEFVFKTLLDYATDTEQAGLPFLLGLEPAVQFDFAITFFQSTLGVPLDQQRVGQVVLAGLLDSCMSRWEPPYRDLFRARVAFVTGNQGGVEASLRAAAEGFSTLRRPVDRAGVLLELSGCIDEDAVAGRRSLSMRLSRLRLLESLGLARRAYQLYREAGDEQGMAAAQDNMASSLLAMGHIDPALRLEERSREIQSREPGYSRRKAVVYGNLSTIYLLKGDLRKAEGYLYETCAHYSYLGEWQGVLRHLVNVHMGIQHLGGSQQERLGSLAYRRVVEFAEATRGRRGYSEIFPIVLNVLGNLLLERLAAGDRGSAVESFRELLRTLPEHAEDEDTVAAVYSFAARILARFGERGVGGQLTDLLGGSGSYLIQCGDALIDCATRNLDGLSLRLQSIGLAQKAAEDLATLAKRVWQDQIGICQRGVVTPAGP